MDALTCDWGRPDCLRPYGLALSLDPGRLCRACENGLDRELLAAVADAGGRAIARRAAAGRAFALALRSAGPTPAL